MSRDYHSTELIGRLAANPETSYAQKTGIAVTRLKVLVNEQWKDGAGNDQKHVESYIVVAFNGLAEACGNHLASGSKVFVRGRNRTRSYDKDGGKRYLTELLADTVVFLEAAKDADRPTPGRPQPEPTQITEDDVPFDPGPRTV
ncbi:MAG: single-stranded DNA-binding protein [Acidobacteriaceae bacterium]|nr:single-stranded DNA-binding protein [Acidobacteriaceae bacterium]